MTQKEIRISDLICEKLWDSFNDTEHTHKILTSGRAGTKTSEAAIEAVYKIISIQDCSGVVLRKRHNKLRKTVYKEIKRAIKRLGLSESLFKITVSPMEITYKPNGNTIYFAGSDSIDDTKGIIDESKPIKFVILDEVNEFFSEGEGEDELQNIEATFIRGNDEGFQMLYLFNPPKNPNAPVMEWLRKMQKRPDVLHTHLDYRDVPVSWLGKKLVAAAELLRQIDERQWRWLWCGESIGIDELIYYMFSMEKHVEKKDAQYNIIGIGVDYGQQNATTYQAGGLDFKSRKFRGLGEFYHSGRDSGKQKSPSEYASEFIKFCSILNKAYNCPAFIAYIDPSAQGLSEEIKRQAKAQSQFTITVKSAENAVALGISRCQKIFTYEVVSVDPSQEHLVGEFGTYEYDAKSIEKGEEKPVKVNDHCCDAWRYLVMGFWSKIKYFLPRSEQED